MKKQKIDKMDGVQKQHFLKSNAQYLNKSLGDLTGLSKFGFHIIEVQPGRDSTERYKHLHKDIGVEYGIVKTAL